MRTRKALRTSLPLATLALAATALPAATTFHPLPSSGSDRFDYAIGRGGNGTVAGHSHEFESVLPVLWHNADSAYTGPSALALPNGSQGGEARWISADAAFVAGFAALPVAGRDDINTVPVLWARGAGGAYSASVLPRLNGAVSETMILGGNTAGTRLVGQSGASPVAAVWRGTPPSSYTVQAPLLPAGAIGASSALALSADGARAVGTYETADGTQSVVWTDLGSAYSPRKLANLSGGSQAFVETVSRDGALAAGAAETGGGLRPTVWDAATGAARELATLGHFEATVLTIAENNAWFGGRATDPGSFAGVAVLWDSEGRIHQVTTLATAAGVALPGLTPESVTGVHHVANGVYTIVGTGVATLSGATVGYVLENLALATSAPPSPEPPPPVSPEPQPNPQPDPSPEPETVVPPTKPGVGLLKRNQSASGNDSANFAEPSSQPRILGGGRREKDL